MEQTITEAAVTPQGGKRLAGGGKKIPLIILGAVLAAVLTCIGNFSAFYRPCGKPS